MALNALVDSFLPQSEKCGTEMVKVRRNILSKDFRHQGFWFANRSTLVTVILKLLDLSPFCNPGVIKSSYLFLISPWSSPLFTSVI